jgi:hypothetical protein
MPIIRGAASDFTNFQKNNAQSTSPVFTNAPGVYSRVGQAIIPYSTSSAQALASKVSLTASTNTVASFNIRPRGNATQYPFFLDPGKSKVMTGPRYFLD